MSFLMTTGNVIQYSLSRAENWKLGPNGGRYSIKMSLFIIILFFLLSSESFPSSQGPILICFSLILKLIWLSSNNFDFSRLRVLFTSFFICNFPFQIHTLLIYILYIYICIYFRGKMPLTRHFVFFSPELNAPITRTNQKGWSWRVRLPSVMQLKCSIVAGSSIAAAHRVRQLVVPATPIVNWRRSLRRTNAVHYTISSRTVYVVIGFIVLLLHTRCEIHFKFRHSPFWLWLLMNYWMKSFLNYNTWNQSIECVTID